MAIKTNHSNKSSTSINTRAGLAHNNKNLFAPNPGRRFFTITAWFTDLGGTPRPLIVTIRGNEDDIRVLLYSCSYYSTIAGLGVLLRHGSQISCLGVLGCHEPAWQIALKASESQWIM